MLPLEKRLSEKIGGEEREERSEEWRQFRWEIQRGEGRERDEGGACR